MRIRTQQANGLGKDQHMSQQFSVFAICETRPSLEAVTETLLSAGFSSSDISALFPENVSLTDAASAPELKPDETNHKATGPHEVVSGTLGVLAGLSMLVIPGLGPLIGEGTLRAGLAGLGIQSAVGDIARSLIKIGVPELEAKRYEDRLQRNGILLAVGCATQEQAKRAAETVRQAGAQDVCTAEHPDATASDPNVGRKTVGGTD
jgi:hypothetical protein